MYKQKIAPSYPVIRELLLLAENKIMVENQWAE